MISHCIFVWYHTVNCMRTEDFEFGLENRASRNEDWGPRTEGWGLEMGFWRFRTEDWGLRTASHVLVINLWSSNLKPQSTVLSLQSSKKEKILASCFSQLTQPCTALCMTAKTAANLPQNCNALKLLKLDPSLSHNFLKYCWQSKPEKIPPIYYARHLPPSPP